MENQHLINPFWKNRGKSLTRNDQEKISSFKSPALLNDFGTAYLSPKYWPKTRPHWPSFVPHLPPSVRSLRNKGAAIVDPSESLGMRWIDLALLWPGRVKRSQCQWYPRNVPVERLSPAIRWPLHHVIHRAVLGFDVDFLSHSKRSVSPGHSPDHYDALMHSGCALERWHPWPNSRKPLEFLVIRPTTAACWWKPTSSAELSGCRPHCCCHVWTANWWQRNQDFWGGSTGAAGASTSRLVISSWQKQTLTNRFVMLLSEMSTHAHKVLLHRIYYILYGLWWSLSTVSQSFASLSVSQTALEQN